MTFKAKAIPTLYNGVQFRSRLEARWAAMFDLLEWRWEYEPIDLDGYIPDFIITPLLRSQVLIEVKPLTEWPCAVPGCLCGSKDEDLRKTYDAAVSKIQSSGWSGESIIVGATLPRSKSGSFAKIGQPVESVIGSGSWFDTGSVLVECRSCAAKLLKPDVEGFGVGHTCDERERQAIEVDPVPFWRRAGNLVQWKAPVEYEAPPTQQESKQLVPKAEVFAMLRAALEEWD